MNQSILEQSRFIQSDYPHENDTNRHQQRPASSLELGQNQQKQKIEANAATVLWPSNNTNNHSDIISNHEKSFASPQSNGAPSNFINFNKQSIQSDVTNSQNATATPHSQSHQVHQNLQNLNDQDYQNQMQKSAQNQSEIQHQQSYVSELEYESKFIEGDYDGKEPILQTTLANLSGQDLLNDASFHQQNNPATHLQTLQQQQQYHQHRSSHSHHSHHSHQSTGEHDQSMHLHEEGGVSLANKSQLSASGRGNAMNDYMNQSLGNAVDPRQLRSIDKNSANSDHGDRQITAEDKPISQHKMTFEQLLESKLLEDGGDTNYHSNTVAASGSKREFLRKNSNNRSAMMDQSRSNNKSYKYYADNFTNQQNPLVVHQSPRGQSASHPLNISTANHGGQTSNFKKFNTQHTNQHSQSKSTQKVQPKQQFSGKKSSPQPSQSNLNQNSNIYNQALLNRPHSSQHQQYEPKFNNSKNDNVPLRTTMGGSANKQRQQQQQQNSSNVQQISNQNDNTTTANKIMDQSASAILINDSIISNSQNSMTTKSNKKSAKKQFITNVSNKNDLSTTKSKNNNNNNQMSRNDQNVMSGDILPLKIDEHQQILLSDRNSIAEFEQLEQECIAKYLQNQSMQIFPDSHNQLDRLNSNEDYLLESQSVQSHSNNRITITSSNNNAHINASNKKKKSPKNKSSKKVTPMKSLQMLNHGGSTASGCVSQTQPITPKKHSIQEGPQSLENTMTLAPLSVNNQKPLQETPKSAQVKSNNVNNQNLNQSSSHQPETSDSLKRLDAKIQELEFEIQRFKQEKSKVCALQQEYEEQLERVTREIEDFENRKELEVEEIQQWKEEQIKEIEQERLQIESDKLQILQEREQILREKQRFQDQFQSETERLMYQIQCLERDNQELNRKLCEFTDKECYDVGQQTEEIKVQEMEVNTVITGDVQIVKQSQSQALSPLRGILKNSSTSPRPQEEKEQTQLYIEPQTFEQNIILNEQELQLRIKKQLQKDNLNVSIQAQEEPIQKHQQELQTSFIEQNSSRMIEDQINVNVLQNQIVMKKDTTTQRNMLEPSVQSISQYQKRLETYDSPQQIDDEEMKQDQDQQDDYHDNHIHTSANDSNQRSADKQNKQIDSINVFKQETAAEVQVQQQDKKQDSNTKNSDRLSQKTATFANNNLQNTIQKSQTSSNKSTSQQSHQKLIDSSQQLKSSTQQQHQQVYQVQKKQGIAASHSSQQNKVLSPNPSQSALVSQRSSSQTVHQQVQNQPPSQQQQPMLQSKQYSMQSQSDKQDTQEITNEYADDNVDEEEDSEEDEFDLKFPHEYHGKQLKPANMIEEITSHDGKKQRFYDNGKKEVIFSNGVRREVWPTGYSIVYFTNNDIKQTFPDQKVVYYFAEAKTTQTTFPNGLQVFKFSNNQIEKHFQDGTKEISFPDGTIKCLFPDGEEESIFPDGTIQKIEKTGVRIIEFPSGQRDVLYPDGTKVREFEDGSIKKIHPDGRVEMIQASKKKVVASTAQPKNLNKYMNQPRKK